MSDDVPTLFDQPVELVDPVLPYGGTSGWSGSQTSRERAEREDADGTTSRRQKAVVQLLAQRGRVGMTWDELGTALGLHHGAASGVLSTLHKAGAISRLTERRNKSQVYVDNAHVEGRPTAPYKPNVSARLLEDILEELLADISRGQIVTAKARICVTLQHLKGQENI